MAAGLLDDLVSKLPQRPGRRSIALGVVLLVFGAVVLGWLGWQFVGSSLVARYQYAAQLDQLRTQWERGEPPAVSSPPASGQAYAILRVPKFGDRFEVPIVAGVDQRDLAKGVGAYPSSVAPGQVGNFALAGYRITHGGPFGKLLRLEPSDEVVIETRDKVYTYVIDVGAAEVTVKDDAAWVLDPVPGRPGAEATQPTLTMTTSEDLLGSPDRSVAFGHLGSTRNK